MTSTTAHALGLSAVESSRAGGSIDLPIADDARRLLESLHLPVKCFQENVAHQCGQKAARRLGLELQSVVPAPANQARTRQTDATLRVSFFSFGAGAGATTVAAQVALAVAQRGYRCLVDSHQATDLSQRLGIKAATSPALPAEELINGFWCEQRGIWREGKNENVVSPDLMIYDAEHDFKSSAHEIILIIAPTLVKKPLRLPVGWTRILINRFDARRSLDRDLAAALRGLLGGFLLPITIQDDPWVSEALAKHNTVLAEAPDSQVSADYQRLGDWLVTRRSEP